MGDAGFLLTDQLRLMAAHFPDELGYRAIDQGDLTFAAWEAESNRLARGLVAAGVAKGERVSIFLGPEHAVRWIVAYSAVHKAGAVAVPTNIRLARRELDLILGHAEVAAVISGGEHLAAAVDLRQSVPSIRVVVSANGASDDGADDGARAWADVLDADDSTFQVPLDREDLADIMYTSGTTGTPKGVAVRHRNIALIPNNVPAWTGDAWMHGSPLFTFAGIGFIYNPMKMGMRGIYLPKFDTGRWIELVEHERPTMVFLVPAMAQLLISHPAFDGADLSSVALCSLGSAPVAPETIRRLQEKMPHATVANGYGMTEAGPAFCSTPREEARRRIGSVGKPMPPLEVRIVDTGGLDVEPGQVGEVLLRLEGREREYYKDPDATARTWSGGWLHSGDLGHVDEDGYLYIDGRVKEVIIRGGNNIYATDVEAVLFEHPSVREAAVVGVPHDVLGEDVAAFVVLRESGAGDSVTVDDLRAFCASRLADYKVPRRITFVDELPRNATGKVLKQELVSRAAP